MRKLLLMSIVLLLLSQTTALAGLIFTNETLPVTATSNDVATVEGTASAFNILGLFTIGDAGINSAAKSAKITKISYVDRNNMCFLYIFGIQTTHVYGQ